MGAAVLVAGVFAGSAAWWLSLSSGVAWMRHRVGARQLRVIQWTAGLVLLAFGAWAIVAVLVN
jgi:hypothetical protein